MNKQERYRAQVASLEHLLDLKRGGYSPTRTEIDVDARDRITRAPGGYPLERRKASTGFHRMGSHAQNFFCRR